MSNTFTGSGPIKFSSAVNGQSRICHIRHYFDSSLLYTWQICRWRFTSTPTVTDSLEQLLSSHSKRTDLKFNILAGNLFVTTRVEIKLKLYQSKLKLWRDYDTDLNLCCFKLRTVKRLTQQTAGCRGKLVVISRSCSQHTLQNNGFVESGRMHQPAKSHTLSYFVNRLFHETRRQVQAHYSTACRRHLSH